MSILVDTNVLSELLRASPDPRVMSWVAAQATDTLFVSAVTQAEMMLGASLLPAGKRRALLEDALRGIFAQDFARRILPFDTDAVPAYVDVMTRRRSAGRPISQFDARIAAIALRRGDSLATRNVDDFRDCGIALINPWD